MEARARLLGPPAVHVRGGWVSLKPGRADAVVAYLARRGAPVRRGEVAALLWPNSAAPQASNNLRQAVRTLSMRPLEPLLGRDRERLWFDASSDVATFEDALRDGRWGDAAATYRGTFLDGFELDDADEFASWLASERSALAERWRHACLTLIDEAEQRGDHAAALELADRVLRADPLDELAVRRAITAATGLGDRLGARRRLDAFRTLLERELGVEPEAATVAMLERAEGALGELQPSSSQQVATSPPIVDDPGHRLRMDAFAHAGRRIVGRVDVLAALHERLVTGTERLVTLLAPGGMGKTAVAAAFVDRAAATFPDGVVHVNLEGVADHDGVAPAVANAARIRLDGSAPMLPQLIANLAPRRALLVVDAFERHLEGVGVLDALLRASGSVVRLLVTSRERLRHTWESVVEVGPLGMADSDPSSGQVPSDAARLFLAVAGWRPEALSDDERTLVERIAMLLGGAPLALELAAAWTDVMPLDALSRELERSWELLSSDEVDRADRHRDVVAMIRETWERLGTDDRAAFARLAVLPGTLDRRVALEVAGTGWRGLRRLLERAVLRRVGDRLELHALLARFGRDRARELGLEDAAWDAALAAWHEHAAVEVDPTTGRYRPLEGDDLTQVAGVVRRALVRREWSAVADLAFPVLLGLLRASRVPERRSLVVDAIAALERGRGRERARALARWLPHGPQREVRRARAAYERALRMAEAVGDDRGVAQAHEALATLHEGVAGFAHRERAHAAYVRCGDDYGRASMCSGWSDQLAKLGFEDASLQRGHEALETFRRLGDLLGQARAVDAIATVDLIRGRTEPTRRLVAEARELFERSGARHMALITLATESWLCATIGDHATVLHHIPTMLAGTGAPERVATFGQMGYECLVQAHVGLGDLPSALRDATHLVEQTAALGAPAPAARCLSNIGQLAEALGEFELARELLTEAWHHPVLWFANQAETRAALERLGVDPGPPCSGPLPDTSAVTARLAAAVERLRGATSSPSTTAITA